MFSVPNACAGYIVGPGDIAGFTLDGSFDSISVDLSRPVTLGPGSYFASLFHHEFAQPGGNLTITGTITPVLVTGSGTNFTPLAVGSTLTYTGPTGFISTAFGGVDAFTLTATTTVYGGFFWDASHLGASPELVDERNPIGLLNEVGSVFLIFGGGTGSGANPPAVGTVMTGTGTGFFARTYDFSIEVDNQVPAVPEPSSLVLTVVGSCVLGVRYMKQSSQFRV